MAAGRRLAAILVADMVDSTAAAQFNEAEALKLRDEQEALVHALIVGHQGREIKSTGDGCLAEFGSALRAVQCAIDIQKQLHERNAQPAVTKLQIRIGVHLGDVEPRGGDIFGDAVNIASRIEPLALPGGICISREVFSQVRNKISNEFEHLPSVALKGVQVPMEIYRLVLPWASEGPTRDPLGLPLHHRTRVAVLPFVNLSPEPNDEFFADGLTDELITRLYGAKGLEVIGRTSVMTYKRKEKNIVQIGKELRVASIIEGSVRKVGNKIRVTAKLVDAGTDVQVWASSYDRSLGDIFAIQTDIATKVAGSAHAVLQGPAIEVQPPETTDLEAYTEFLQGRHLLNTPSPESWKESVKHFKVAIARVPGFARAYVGLAQAYQVLFEGGLVSFDEGSPAATDTVRRALALNDSLAEAHSVLAKILWNADDGIGAEQEARRAIELNPNLPGPYETLCEAVALRSGETAESLGLIETAYHLDPVSPVPVSMMGGWLLYAGREAEFLEFWGKNRGLNPFRANADLAVYYTVKGDLGRATESLNEAARQRPDFPLTKMLEGYIAGVSGDRAAALRSKTELEQSYPDRPSPAGVILLGLGEVDAFFEKLDEAFVKHDLESAFLMFSPLLAGVRRDSRFGNLIAKLRSRVFPGAP